MKSVVGHIKRGKRKYDIYDSDCFIVSYPRSGNTWLRYLITNIIHHDREIDFELVNKTIIGIYQNEEYLRQYGPRRFIKSHEAYTPSYPKVVYIYRDGRDVAGSYFRFYQKNFGYEKSFEIFVRELLADKLAFGSWQKHVQSWLFRRHENPFFSIKYEDLLDHTESIVNQLCDFIEIKATPEIIKRSIDQSSARIQHMMYADSRKLQKKKVPHIVTKHFKWINCFNKDLQEYFFKRAGDVMEKLGYEPYCF